MKPLLSCHRPTRRHAASRSVAPRHIRHRAAVAAMTVACAAVVGPVVSSTGASASSAVGSASPANAGSPSPGSPGGSCANSVTYTVSSGDTWSGIAGQARVGIGSLYSANDASESRLLHPGDVLCLPDGADVANLPALSRCPVGSSGTHTVRSGDHWYGIAGSAGIAMSRLLDANSSTDDRLLHPGDVLCLPSGATAATQSAAASVGDASEAAADASCAAAYTVRSGDHWYGIAGSAGIGISALYRANDAGEDRLLHPGDELCLPDGATAPAAATTDTTATNATGSGCSSDYTVRSGDSWFDIARLSDVGISALYRANDAGEERLLHPGDVLCLPEGATAPEAARSAAAAPTLQAMPTQGPCWFSDSWHAPRGAGRVHMGVDLFVTPGQYVYAVVDGTLTRRAWDQPGLRAGNAWWLTAADGSGTYYFYAHLSDFAPNLEVGSRVRAGQVIGFVGATGNAAAPHLHFEIHPGGGAAINPYPSLRAAGGCNTGTPYEQPGGWTPERLGS